MRGYRFLFLLGIAAGLAPTVAQTQEPKDESQKTKQVSASTSVSSQQSSREAENDPSQEVKSLDFNEADEDDDKDLNLLGGLLDSKEEEGPNKEPDVILNPNGLTPEMLDSVNKAISTVTRQADDQDASEMDRIRRKGRDVIVSALATQGYFSPDVTLNVETDDLGDIWDVQIDPGVRSHIKLVNNKFKGRIMNPQYEQRRYNMLKEWELPPEKPFVNETWSDAKANLLEKVAAEDFYLARMTDSRAEVDPDEATVDLMTEIDSGPAVKLGNIEVIGLRRVPISVINKYVNYKPGDSYKEKDFEDWQQSLMATNFFRGAFLNIKKPDGSDIYKQDEATLPVVVRVTEAPARTIQGNFGIDSVNKVLVEGTYRQNIVGDWPVTMETGASLGFKEQRAYLDFYLPPSADGSVDRFGIVARHSDFSDEEVSRFGASWRHSNTFKLDESSRVDYETLWSLVGAMDKVNRKNGPKYTLPSLVASWSILRRDVDDKFNPREGNLQVLDLAAGMDVRNRDPFYRAGFRTQFWFPVGRRDNFSIRGEVGYVKADKDTRFPDDFGYRVGGPRTVRGYRYLDKGRKSGDAVVGTRSMYTASAEYTHYFNDFLGVAAFVDAGDADETFADLKPLVGYGVGGRVKTPAGPLFIDLAYGQHDRKLRLHFSMGIAF